MSSFLQAFAIESESYETRTCSSKAGAEAIKEHRLSIKKQVSGLLRGSSNGD